MTLRPRIAITIGPRISARADEHGDKRYDICAHYADVITAFGGMPIMVTPNCAFIEQTIADADAFLLPGGSFPTPECGYKEGGMPLDLSFIPETYNPRLKYEITLVREAARLKVPFLGICAGMQIINLAFPNGTLTNNLSETYETPGEMHKAPQDAVEYAHHTLQLTPGSQIHSVIGEERITVNSSHREAIQVLGKDLRITGISQDGVPEIIEHETLPIIGVQFHPERETHLPFSRKIFENLIAQATAYHQTK